MPNAISLYKISRWMYLNRVPVFPKIIQGLIFLIYNSKLPYKANIGQGTFCVVKGVGVVVHDKSVIGKNCRLGIGCKIVGKGPYQSVARIGNNVFIGPGAVIVGPVIVEDDVIIAPNAVVTKSVPEGAIVGGIPAKIIGWQSDLTYDIMKNESFLTQHADYLS